MQAHISSVNTSLTGVQVGTISKNPQPKLPDTGSLDE
jgi:hypothetical protein